jgi:hypothetical protein
LQKQIVFRVFFLVFFWEVGSKFPLYSLAIALAMCPVALRSRALVKILASLVPLGGFRANGKRLCYSWPP